MKDEELHERFKAELSMLLSKYKAEISVEDFGRGYSTDEKIVVDFEFIENERYYSQLVLGRYID